jgi:hypothetical protein
MIPAVATSVHVLELQILGLTVGCRLPHMFDDLFYVSNGGSDPIRWMEMRQTFYRKLISNAVNVVPETRSYETH